MALGAGPRDVLLAVAGQGMALSIAGTALGAAAALALTRVVSTLLFGIAATDPATFVTASLLLLLVALAACYVPARRAMKIDPILALRED